MIKAIFFDLDWVLADIKDIHFDSLNDALPEDCKISKEKHYAMFDWLPTMEKLKILKAQWHVLNEVDIEENKQEFTLSRLKKYHVPYHVIETVRHLCQEYYLWVCSNSVYQTVDIITKQFDTWAFNVTYSNNDVCESKPHPEIYIKATLESWFSPNEVLIIEDSPRWVHAALASGCHVLRVNDTWEVTIENIMNEISRINKLDRNDVYQNRKMNVVIPMAWRWSRFQEQGYVMPKPLIDVEWKFMIQRVIENINIDANYVFIVKKEDIEKHNIDLILKALKPDCKIVITDGITEGTACTCLLAKEHIDNDNPVFFCNSDQLVLDWKPNEFFYNALCRELDASILTFPAEWNKWSYAKTDENGRVTEVAEKNAISNEATVWFYYYKHWKDFVKAAESMIKKNIRTNNEFYLCPVFNEVLKEKKYVWTYKCKEMYGIWTPDDLKLFLNIKQYIWS